jgi:hypothetical protein
LSGASHAATPVANRSAAKVGMRALFGVEFIRGPSPKCGPRVPESERSHGYKEDTAVARRSALEEHQRDLEQKLADVAEQLRDLPADEPEESE